MANTQSDDHCSFFLASKCFENLSDGTFSFQLIAVDFMSLTTPGSASEANQ